MSLYGVVIVDKSIIRDINISNLLNDDIFKVDSGDFQGDFIYILGKDKIFTVHTLRYLSYGKLYKTLKGARKLYKELINSINSTNIYNSHFLSKYDPKSHVIVVSEISKKWNEMLDILIEIENKKHESEIEKLQKKYI